MGTLIAQICFFAALPLLTGVWACCLLREHGLLSFHRMAMRTRRLPGGRLLLLAMAAAAVAYGGSKGGGSDPSEDPPPQVEPADEHDIDEEQNVLLISSLPYVIKGRSSQQIQFRMAMAAVYAPIAIHTYTGTGTVYSATLSVEDESITLSDDAKTMLLIPERVYRVNVSGSNVSPDSRYVIRIGTFNPQLVVTFDGNGGTVSPQWKTYQPGRPYETFPSAEWENHLFTGWATEATNGIVLSADTAACVGYTNLYAQWQSVVPTNMPPTIITNFVEFVGNGGEGSMATQMVVSGEAQALASNLFERTTYDFAGWALSRTGEVVYAEGAVVSNLSDVAGAVVPLYAQWTRMTNVYDVVFDPNGGQGAMESQAFFLNEPQSLATNRFVRGGYDFAGWATTTNGAALYADCQIVTNVATNAGDAVSLYATWKVVPLPVLSTNINGVTWHYTVTNGQATIMRHTNEVFCTAVSPLSVAHLTVPETLLDGTGTNVCTVTAIGENAFGGLASLTNIVIPAAVSILPAGVFSGCGKIVVATLPVTVPLFSLMPDSYTKIKRVEVPGTEAFLDDEVTVCDYAFSNCTALAYVDLPLGVAELPEGVFCGCTALASFEMPYTVTTIGEGAFRGCTGLTALSVTENVTEIGANAFTDCSSLRIVRYLGDEPEAAEGGTGNIYYHANTGLVSGYLAGLRTWSSVPEAEESGTAVADADDDDDSGDGATGSSGGASSTAVKWPNGGAGRPLYAWNNTLYKFKKVTFDYNDGGKTQPEEIFYVMGRVVGELPEPGSAGFCGWFTKKHGGEEVDPYTAVNAAMTFYAHWEGDTSGAGTRGTVDALSPFYSDDDGFAFSAATFDGLLLDDGVVAGTIRVKVKQGKVQTTGETNSAFTATMQVRGAKKASLSGSVGADGTAEAANEKKGLSLELEFSQFGMTGTYSTDAGNYEIVAARDRYSAGSDDAKALIRAALANAKSSWNIVLPTESAEGDGSVFATGYSTLTATIGTKGKAKIKGTMADGTKVSVSSTLLVGDSCCCLPVVVPLYPGKTGGFAFALWFTWSDDASESTVEVAGCSEWDATRRKGGGFTATFGEPILDEAGASAVPAAVTFQMEEFFDFDGAVSDFSPDGTAIDARGGAWKLPKADTVKFTKDGGWHTPDGKDYGNPAGLKLRYKALTGLFKGSFRVFVETDSGKSKRRSATVTGVVVQGVGYGTATVKKAGSLPVMVAE